MTTLSQKKKLEIANVCYANVVGQFAMFNNPKFRGPNFTWESFIQRMQDEADLWMGIHNIKGNKQMVNDCAKEFAKEIATTLVGHLTA